MEPGRTTREQRGGMRDDDLSTGGQRDNPGALANYLSLDYTGGQGGDTYTSQQSGYGANTGGTQPDRYNTAGGGTGPPGGLDTQPDRYNTADQWGGPDSDTTNHAAGYVDPTRNVRWGRREGDDEYGAAVGGDGSGSTGKPSITSRVMGAAERMTGKIMGDPGKQARGREREEGTF